MNLLKTCFLFTEPFSLHWKLTNSSINKPVNENSQNDTKSHKINLK